MLFSVECKYWGVYLLNSELKNHIVTVHEARKCMRSSCNKKIYQLEESYYCMHRTKVTFGMFLFIQRHVKQVIFGTPTLTIWNLDSSLSKWKRGHTDILGYIPTSPSSKDQSTCLNIKVCLNVNNTGALGATFSNTD